MLYGSQNVEVLGVDSKLIIKPNEDEIEAGFTFMEAELTVVGVDTVTFTFYDENSEQIDEFSVSSNS